MSDIQTFLDKIRLARYGKDVRQSICDAIEEIDKVADTAQNSATQSAKNASSSAEAAAQSEANALEYANASSDSAEEAKDSETNALAYKNAASSSAQDAEASNQSANGYAEDSADSASKSAQSEANALSYSQSAKSYADQINDRIDEAATSAQSAKQYAANASSSASDAEKQALSADESANVAEQHALMAESYTHGGTGLRTNEAVDNAQYFLEQAKQLSQSMNGLIPMGTIAFADLSLVENQVNKYMFNISDDFTTDSTFKEGAGHKFPAGTNVFRTNDGYWDCLAGSFLTPNGDTKDNTVTFTQSSSRVNIKTGEKFSVIFGKIAKFFADLKTVAFSGSYNDLSDTPTIPAAVAVKGNKETTYRTGNVNLTPANIGAVAVGGNTATNTVTFTSGDSTEPTGWSDVDKITTGITHANFFNRVSTMIKNVRWLYKALGSTDISKIGDGTCTGAISTINNNLTNNSDAITELNSNLNEHYITTEYGVKGLNLKNSNSYQDNATVIWNNSSETASYGTVIGDYNSVHNTELIMHDGILTVRNTYEDKTYTDNTIVLNSKFVIGKATFSAIGSKSYQAVGVWLGYELDDTGKYDVYTTLTYNGAYWGNLNLNVIKENNRFDICCFNTGDGATDNNVTVSYLIVRNDL